MIKGRILLAEDDLSFAFVLKDTLEDEGFKVVHFKNGQEAIEGFDKDKFDICLLDIMMPLKDGYAIAKKIRQQSDVIPIIILSTRGHLDDKLKGYGIGVDDYLTKPFSMEELFKKVEVFLRRSKKMHSESISEYQINKFLFSYTELKIIHSDEIFNITQKEADLLKFLCENKNKVLKREEVLRHVWGKDDFFLGRSMDVYMTRLRKFFRTDPLILIETIHGIGFRFTVSSPLIE